MNDEELSHLIQKNATRHSASERLRAAVRTQAALQAAAGETPPARQRRPWPVLEWRSALTGFFGGALVAVAVVLAVPRVLEQQRSGSLPAELVADHLRSLKIGPLYAVASSDRHTVKPWFQGRLDYAPPVIDLASQGFALLGGRVEQVEGSATAALVYERGHHLINAFVSPADRGQVLPKASQIRGFNLLHWSDGVMQVWLVSDIEAGELERFREEWQAQRR